MGALGAAAIGGVALGGIGQLAASSDRAKQLAANKEAVQKWLDLNIPDPEQQKIVLKQYVSSGKLDPQVEQAIKRDPSAFENITKDQGLRQSQLRALTTLENLGSQGGLDLTDQSNLQKTLGDINTQDRGKREAIVDSFSRRGLGGSGLELAAQLQNAQDQGTRASNTQLDTLASARQRALNSIIAGGQLAGNIANTDYGQQADLAKARDAISAFNAQNMQGVQERNTNRMNDAQTYNLGQNQNISNMNTDLANREQIYNKELAQKEFQNKTQQVAGATGQYGGLANTYGQQAQNTADLFGNVGAGVIKAGTAYDQSQKKAKANQSDDWEEWS